MLSEKQVDFILNDIRRNGIQTEELQLNLLDHICCLIENEMSPENDFDEIYQRAKGNSRRNRFIINI